MGTGSGQGETEVSTWAGNFTGPCMGSPCIPGWTPRRASPPAAGLALAALLLNPLPLAKHFPLWACESPTSSLTLMLFCCLFASESSKGLLNKLHFIWDATKKFSQAVMMPLRPARAAAPPTKPGLFLAFPPVPCVSLGSPLGFSIGDGHAMNGSLFRARCGTSGRVSASAALRNSGFY